MTLPTLLHYAIPWGISIGFLLGLLVGVRLQVEPSEDNEAEGEEGK